MNIFYLHHNPYLAATYFYDKHKVKMILECAQMLCTAHHHYAELYEYDDSYIPYKKAHYNHPSTQWARENMQHYFWLYDYMMALGEEYTKRYNKKHWGNKANLKKWVKDEQPYYKKHIPEVYNYFLKKSGL